MADLDAEEILGAHTRRTTSAEEKFERIAAGDGIALVPSSVAGSYLLPGIVYVPVTDAEPVETCIAVAKGRREHRIRDFVKFAEHTLGQRS
jgi:DNA-binding transcriptional LysR family regulator